MYAVSELQANSIECEVYYPRAACPARCQCLCDDVYGYIVICSDIGLTDVPDNVPTETNILRLDSNINITALTPSSVGKLSKCNLTYLRLPQCGLTRIEKNTFLSLHTLQLLDLVQNQLGKSDNSQSFGGLETLEILYLDANNLTSASDLPSAKNLKFLSLFNNPIQSIPDHSSLESLETLNISLISMTDIWFPPGFKRLLKLRSINLSKNPVEVFSTSGWANVNVGKIVEFIYCDVEVVSKFEEDFFAKFSNLQTVKLDNIKQSSDSIKTLINSLARVKTLKELSLKGSMINEVWQAGLFSPLNETALETLNLDSLKVSTVPKNMFTTLCNLKVLSMANGLIDIIEPGAFDGLYALETLDLTGSLMQSVHLCCNLFPLNLKILNLNENKLSRFASDDFYMFRKLYYLTHLTLSYCQVPMISVYQFPASLRYLDVSWLMYSNRRALFFIRGIFGNLVQLEYLDLTAFANGISNEIFPDLIRNLRKMQILKLSYNRIGYIAPGTFDHMTQLKYLDLDNNNLKAYTASLDRIIFYALPSLLHISLASNSISGISSGEFLDKFLRKETPTELLLAGNPFDCGCQNTLLYQLLLDTAVAYRLLDRESYTCQTPLEYADKQFANKDFIDKVRRGCSQMFTYVAVAAVATLISTIIAAVTYRQRWYVRWACYKIRVGRHHRAVNGETTEQHNQCLYDVYVSYHHNEVDWIAICV